MDDAAIIAHLEECGVDTDAVRCIEAALQRRGGRDRNDAEFEARVEARRYYKRGRAKQVPKKTLIAEMVALFEIPENVAEHLAEPRSYTAERAEADRRDAETPTDASVGPTEV